MKKLRFFSMLCLLALIIGFFAGCKKDEVNNNGNDNVNGGSGGSGGALAGYVDLGLPSGTKWKASNEIGNGSGFYTFDEAVSTFGSQLPTKEQFEELTIYCTWTWQNIGSYRITGQNGNFIVLPAAGYREPDCIYNVGSSGNYWSSTTGDSECGWGLGFDSGNVIMFNGLRFFGFAVRLVKD